MSQPHESSEASWSLEMLSEILWNMEDILKLISKKSLVKIQSPAHRKAFSHQPESQNFRN